MFRYSSIFLVVLGWEETDDHPRFYQCRSDRDCRDSDFCVKYMWMNELTRATGSAVSCTNKHSCQGETTTWNYGSEDSEFIQFFCTDRQKEEAYSERAPEGFKEYDERKWSEWTEVCNPRNPRCPEGLRCVSFFYADDDDTLTQQ